MDTIKLSCFTPTHRPEHLPEVYNSLLLQHHQNWEWVILPSAGAVVTQERFPFLSDSRVRVLPGTNETRIGGLKRMACEGCSGDVFVELDHDDMLVPGVMKKIAKAVDGGAGFVFTDSVAFDSDTLDPRFYNVLFGWESYRTQIFGRSLIATRAFDVTPRSLAEVYYAPDHVRCWTREAYAAAGGHDASLSVGDDHRLMVQTYIAGVEFKHIKCGGYLYRKHPNNTVNSRQQGIQETSARTKHYYLPKLCHEWGRRNNFDSFNFINLREGYEESTVELIETLSNAKPNSASIIELGRHLAFADGRDVVRIMNLAYDALAPGGFLAGRVPDSTSGRLADQNPLFRCRFNFEFFKNFIDKSYASRLPDNHCRFQTVEVFSHLAPGYDESHDMREITFRLSALKGQRQPGRVYI